MPALFRTTMISHDMNKYLFRILLLFLLPVAAAGAQEGGVRQTLYGVAFYNQENLFDTVHDYGKNDYEYLPDGKMAWGTVKYRAKLEHMSEVLAALCTERVPAGAAVIGLAEVENRRVLEDLVRQPALSARGYRIVHREGPDRRGVDCAFLYDPEQFGLESAMLVPYYYPDPAQPDVDLGFYTDESGCVRPYAELRGDTTRTTRGFLVMGGRMAGEKMYFIVCHWPSRAAGSESRERAGYQVRALKDALARQDPGAKIVIMGDMNDDPGDKSLTEALGCRHRREEAGGVADLYNPWWDTLYEEGQGTLVYRGKWNLFDQIVFTGNLLGEDRSTLKYDRCEVFRRDSLLEQEGPYKGSPKRTHAGGKWLNGYSDHLPTCIYLVKETK